MQPFNLVDNVNTLLGNIASVQQVQKLPETVCKDCLVEMEEIDRKGYKVFNGDRDCQPDFKTTSIDLRCKICGEIVTIDQ